MTKTIYSAAMSLDGYIAGPEGDMSWLAPFVGEPTDGAAERLLHGTGALLVGHTTFLGDDPNRGTDAEGAFGGRYDGPAVVLTHHVPEEPEPGVVFRGDLASALAAAREAAGDAEYISVLGADVAGQCLAAGELDEILLFVVPLLLGGGTRAFPRSHGTPARLERLPGDDEAHWYRVLSPTSA